MSNGALEARVRALASTASAPALERLVALAAKLLDARHAQVSLLADTQLVAAAHEIEATDGPLEDSICTLTVAERGLLAIPDARGDRRVATLPPVTSGAVGSYLGAPLVTSDGQTVGALCVFDPLPREWSDDDGIILAELAVNVVTELELGAFADALRASTARLELGLAAAQVGSFDWNLRTGELLWDDRLKAVFGYSAQEFEPHIDSFFSRVHPDDAKRVQRAVDAAIAELSEFSAEYRIVLPDGSLRWVAARGRAVSDGGADAARFLGAAFDTTAAHDARQAVARQLEAMPSAFFSLDRDWRFTYLNAEGERVLGQPREALLGQVIWESFPDAIDSAFEVHYRTAVAEARPVMFEAYYPAPLDAWFEVRAWPVPDGLTVYFLDISARRRAEAEREHANHRLQLLVDAGDRLAGSLEGSTVLARLADITVPALGELVVVVVREEVDAAITGRTTPSSDPQRLVVRQVVHRDPQKQAALAALVHARPPSLDDPTGMGIVVRTGAARWFPTVSEERLVAAAAGDQGRLDLLRAIDFSSALMVPLVSRGRTLGAMTVTGPAGGELDRRLVEEVATRAAAALDNAILYGQSRGVGLALQRSLLPRTLPRPHGVEMAVRYQPGVAGMEVGGDFYVAHELGDGRLVVAMGDVMGRGIRAAAQMGQLRSVLLTLAYGGDPPDRVLDRLSGVVQELLELELATLLLGLYDPAERLLLLSSAGHPPPLLAPLDRVPYFLPVEPGPPLGAGPGAHELHHLDLPAGSTLVLYTDGLIEKRDEGIEDGMEVLRQALIEIRLPPEAVADHVLRKTGRDKGSDDDVALLVLSHLPAD